jgi:hypothetical protein
MSSPIDHQARLERQYQRLGTRTPCCTVCGEADPDCLERHHIAGCAYDDATVIVCRNCHRKQSEEQNSDPDILAGDDQPLFRAGRFLMGLARMLEAIAPSLRTLAQDLIDRARNRSEGAS